MRRHPLGTDRSKHILWRKDNAALRARRRRPRTFADENDSPEIVAMTLLRTLSIFVLVVVYAASAPAQGQMIRVAGTVVDEAGNVIPGVTVTLTDTDSVNPRRTTLT